MVCIAKIIFMVNKESKTKPIKSVRVRMAPSPTGPLHIGTARTALFNYLFAKKFGGKFILRIEDTDQERSKPEWEKGIIDGLLWLGIEWDEGPDKGGEFGPYRQSERKHIYQKYLGKLLKEKSAYWCFCSEQEIEAYKQERLSIGKPPIFNCSCWELPEKEIEEKLQENTPAVIRFKIPHQEVVFDDLLRGKISYDSSLFDDMVIAKNTNEPLYNLACVIDDWEMKITHVIRGEDHISNTPKQILLAKALVLESPRFLHLPLILGPDRTKLSKRHGATTSIAEYQKQGYLPEALVNFIAFLGWNPGDNQEVFSLDSLTKEFSVEKIQKSGAIFNSQKLDWFNGYFIRQKPLPELTKLCLPYLIDSGLVEKGKESTEKISKMVALYHERLKKLSEIPELIDFFFKENLDYTKELLSWKGAGDSEITTNLDILLNVVSNISEANWTKEKLNEEIMPKAEKLENRGEMLWPFRVALTGKQASAGPFEIAEVLGKEKTIERIKRAMAILINE